MRRLLLLTTGVLLLIALAASGCTQDLVSPVPGAQIASSCVTCHSDKELLQELAVEEEEPESGETTGEG